MDTKKVSRELIDRLVCAKNIYRRGIQILNEPSTFSSGMAVLNFHDATEIFLRVIAEHFDLQISDYENFHSIIGKVNKEAQERGLPPLTNTSGLNQLNQARVNFKHYTLENKSKHATKFKLDLEVFFQITLDNYLGLNFATLSLADMVKDTRTSNWLHRAESHLEASNLHEACACSAIALKIFRKHKHTPRLWDTFNRVERELKDISGNISGSSVKLARAVDEKLDKIRDYVDVLYDGIDPLKYKKFKTFTPEVALSMANTIERPEFKNEKSLSDFDIKSMPQITNDIAVFCCDFVIDTILELQSQSFPPRFNRDFGEVKYETIKKTSIYVYPGNDEIIDTVDKDTILKRSMRFDESHNDDFVKITFEKQEAYIKEENVRKLNDFNSN